jgi:ribonuclease D
MRWALLCKEEMRRNEMKIIKEKFDKKDIQNLPKVQFNGRIITVISERDAEKAVDYLLSQSILGFDSETRPSFKKGTNHQVALLQVSTHDTCFLFRLNRIGMPDAIVRLLENKTVTKVGLSLKDDFMQLRHRRDFTPGNFIDLQKHVGEIGVEDRSLQKLYANFFGQKISKSQQLSNWENDVLQEKQKIYAATDAWACIKLYEELLRLEQTNDFKLVEEEVATA